MANVVSERWERGHSQAKRLAGWLAGCAVILWPLTYFTHSYAATAGEGIWFAAFSTVTFFAACGTTAGAAVIGGGEFINDPPLPGDNY